MTEGDVAEMERGYPFDYGFPHTLLSSTIFDGTDVEEHRSANDRTDVLLPRTAGVFYWVDPQTIRILADEGQREHQKVRIAAIYLKNVMNEDSPWLFHNVYQ